MKPTLCGVIGNPISHSRSPEIHHKFALENGIDLSYQKYLLEEDQLSSFIKHFFDEGGLGLNVTLPFKQQVVNEIDTLSASSKLCQSVNTLYLGKNGEIKGTTTDGEGLLLDLNRLNFSIHKKNILIIGAGGASVSVVYALLKSGTKIRVLNRTQKNALDLIQKMSPFGDISLFNSKEPVDFDGVVSTISLANNELFRLANAHLKEDCFIYDINYGERAEETLNHFRDHGIKKLSGGYGMLLGQAAKSFEIWHGILPKISYGKQP